MAIVLPFPLTIQEMRVLQEFRRVVTDTDGMRYLIPSNLERASRALLAKLP